jgi:hypothetical protein
MGSVSITTTLYIYQNTYLVKVEHEIQFAHVIEERVCHVQRMPAKGSRKKKKSAYEFNFSYSVTSQKRT